MAQSNCYLYTKLVKGSSTVYKEAFEVPGFGYGFDQMGAYETTTKGQVSASPVSFSCSDEAMHALGQLAASQEPSEVFWWRSGTHKGLKAEIIVKVKNGIFTSAHPNVMDKADQGSFTVIGDEIHVFACRYAATGEIIPDSKVSYGFDYTKHKKISGDITGPDQTPVKPS